MAIAIPFAFLFKHYMNIYLRVFAAVSIIIGTYIGKIVFLYGGNAYPLSDRFGVGFEKYFEYGEVKNVIFFMPSYGEIAIVVGSLGIILVIYKVVDSLFCVSLMREH